MNEPQEVEYNNNYLKQSIILERNFINIFGINIIFKEWQKLLRDYSYMRAQQHRMDYFMIRGLNREKTYFDIFAWKKI